MGIINEHFTMPGADMPPQEFLTLKTQQGQINWLAQFLMSVNNVFDNVTGTVTTLDADATGYVEIDFDAENNSAKFDFYVPRGYQGEPGELESVTATATTLAAGQSATVSVAFDQATQSAAFSFGIPEGIPGGEPDKYFKDITPSEIASFTPISGTTCQGSYVDISNNITYLAMISNGSGTVPANQGYIVAFNNATGAEIRRSQILNLYHGNSIDMINGYLYVTLMSSSSVLKINPTTLEIVDTITIPMGAYAALSADENSGYAIIVQGSQLPVVCIFKETTSNNYLALNSFKWELSGLEYNQGACIRNGLIALPAWRIDDNKSFICLYDYNYNLKQILRIYGNMEIEDVTLGSSIIYFTTTNGKLYSLPFGMSGSIAFNQFSYNTPTNLYMLNRNIATTIHPAYSSNTNITESVPVVPLDISGPRTNGDCILRISFGTIEHEIKIVNFSPVSSTYIYCNPSVFIPNFSSGNHHLLFGNIRYYYDASNHTLSLDTSYGALTDVVCNMQTGVSSITKSLSNAIEDQEYFVPVAYAIEIISFVWFPRMLPASLTSGSMYFTL